MKLTKNKIYILILTLLVFLSAVFILWKNFYQPEFHSVVSEQEDISAQKDLPDFAWLSDREVVSPTLSGNQESIWYFEKNTGRLFSQGLYENASAREFPLPGQAPVDFALWPDSGSDFIIGNAHGRFLYSSHQETFFPYPEEVKFVTWLPGQFKLAYIWSGEDDISLSVAEVNLTDFEVKLPLTRDDYRIAVSPNFRSYILYGVNRPLKFVIDGIGAFEYLTEEPLTISKLLYSPTANKIAFAREHNNLHYLHVFDIRERKDTVVGVLAPEGDFVWTEAGEHIIWSDAEKTLKKTDVSNFESLNLLRSHRNLNLVARELILGREGEIFFVESEERRLGRLKIK